MIILAFAVWDAAAEAYLPPFFVSTKGQAIRSFSDAVNEAGHQFALHAKDYTLFHIGSFDQGKGVLSGVNPPDSMGNALQFVVAAAPAARLEA